MTAALQDPVVARRRALILKYRAAHHSYARPWLSEEVFNLSADIGIFNRENSDSPITKEDLGSK